MAATAAAIPVSFGLCDGDARCPPRVGRRGGRVVRSVEGRTVEGRTVEARVDLGAGGVAVDRVCSSAGIGAEAPCRVGIDGRAAAAARVCRKATHLVAFDNDVAAAGGVCCAAGVDVGRTAAANVLNGGRSPGVCNIFDDRRFGDDRPSGATAAADWGGSLDGGVGFLGGGLGIVFVAGLGAAAVMGWSAGLEGGTELREGAFLGLVDVVRERVVFEALEALSGRGARGGFAAEAFLFAGAAEAPPPLSSADGSTCCPTAEDLDTTAASLAVKEVASDGIATCGGGPATLVPGRAPLPVACG